jgi:hypothetical protein
VTIPADLAARFLKAATWHGSLDEAEAMLQAHPELAGSDIRIAAVLGDDAAVRRFIAVDPASVNAKGPPYGADALNYLGLSKYLRLDPARSDGFIRAAAALLDAGAYPNTGLWTTGKFPEFETALYGAAGVAHHAGLTRLLVERGADPRDPDTVYHAPEGDDLGALKVLVETGKLTAQDLSLMLIRKLDWHDLEGARYLLAQGANPGERWNRGWLPLHHSIARDNDLEFAEALLDHGADPTVRKNEQTAVELAARRGRGDLLALFERRGFSVELQGVDRLIAACARNDGDTAHRIAREEPALVTELLAQGGARMAEFAGTWNTEGIRLMLDLGVPVDALYQGDGYFDIAAESTALHVAAWHGLAATVRLLIDRKANVNLTDAKDRTPLMLAVKATVDSYWTHRRTPEAVQALLAAGASILGVKYPSGYAEVDVLLREYGA